MVDEQRKVIHVDLNEPHVWLCARTGGDTTSCNGWEILGVYTEKERAVQRCELQGDYIFALSLNVDLPDENVGIDTELWPLFNHEGGDSDDDK